MKVLVRILCLALLATPSLSASFDVGGGSATIRNGTGINPSIYQANSIPTIGETYVSEVKLAGNGWGLVYAFAFPGASNGVIVPPFGEILVDPSAGQGFFLDIQSSGEGNDTMLFFDIPDDPSLVGVTLATQALFNSSVGIASLTNAIDIVIGC